MTIDPRKKENLPVQSIHQPRFEPQRNRQQGYCTTELPDLHAVNKHVVILEYVSYRVAKLRDKPRQLTGWPRMAWCVL